MPAPVAPRVWRKERRDRAITMLRLGTGRGQSPARPQQVTRRFQTVYPRIHDFRLLVTNRFLLTFGVQVMGVTVAWQSYQRTHDPLTLGLLGLAEAVTYIGSALLAGHAADRLEKRRIILATQTVLFVSVLSLLSLSWGGNTRMGPVYAVIGLTGIARAFLWSASISYAELIVPKEHYGKAAAVTSSSWEIGTVLGPAVGGLLYGMAGPNASYLAAGAVVVKPIPAQVIAAGIPARVIRPRDETPPIP